MKTKTEKLEKDLKAKKKAAKEAKSVADNATKKAEKLAEEVTKLESEITIIKKKDAEDKENVSKKKGGDNSDSGSDSDSSSGGSSDSESDSDSDSDDDKEKSASDTKAIDTKIKDSKKEDSGSSSSSSSVSSDEEDDKKNNCSPVLKARESSKNDDDSSDSDDLSDSDSSDSDSDSDGDGDKKKEEDTKRSKKMEVGEKDDENSSSSSSSSSPDSDSDSQDTPTSNPPGEVKSKKRKKESNDDEEPPQKKQAVSSDNREVNTKLYVRGLPWRATQDQVHDYFSKCGSGPKSVELPLQDDGRSSGTAIIEFHDADSAATAMELNGNDFDGRWLSIKYSTPKPILAPREASVKQKGCVTVFVGNLSWEIDEDTLRDAFKDCGTITQVRFSTDRETGDFKGYGHVEFAETEATDAAVALAGTKILGRAVRVDFANDRRQSFGGGGRFGSGDRGRDARGRFGSVNRGCGGGTDGRGSANRGGRGGPGGASTLHKKSGGIADFAGKKITFN